MPHYPLRITDGAFIIDNSSLEKFMCCRRFYEYSCNLRRVTSHDKPSLNFGKGIHCGMAHRYKFFGTDYQPLETILPPVQEEVTKHFLDNPQPEDDYRTLNLASLLMRRYLQLYHTEPFKVWQHNGKPFVEQSFLFELGMINGLKILYSGRMDLAIEDQHGLWIDDHKTAFQFGNTFWDDMQASAQAVGYCFAFLATTGIKPEGYMINAMRVRKPSKADMALGDEGCFQNDDFERQMFHVSNEQLTEWRTDTLALIQDLFFCEERKFYPRMKKWCVSKYGSCQYYHVCHSPAANRHDMLQSSAFMDNDWSPLNNPQE
jgi:hypothetical protein